MQILGAQRVMMDKEDPWAWKGKESVGFTVKSAYKILEEDVWGGEGVVQGFLEVECITIFTSHSMEGSGRQNSV